MERDFGDDTSLIARVQDHLQSTEGGDLLAAIVRSYNSGGPKAVKALIANTLAVEKELREEDAGE